MTRISGRSNPAHKDVDAVIFRRGPGRRLCVCRESDGSEYILPCEKPGKQSDEYRMTEEEA